MTQTATHHLFDADTAEDLGLATSAQIAASDESDARGEEGIILVDTDGNVVNKDARTATVRRCYTEVA